MSKEKIKLALKDLKWIDNWICEKPMPECVARLRKSIKALEEALANHCEDNLDMVKQEQGELVAWMRQDGQRVTTASDRHNYPDYETRYSIPLYTTPQQRTWERPWVSLTDEEVFETFGNFTAMTGKSWLDLYRITEAKLRSKNNG